MSSYGHSRNASLDLSQASKRNKKKSVVLRIFWPDHMLTTSGWAIGWCHKEFLCIATVIADDLVTMKLENSATEKVSSSSSIDSLSQISVESSPSSTSNITVIVNCEDDSTSVSDENVSLRLDPPQTLQAKVALLNQDFAKEYWKTPLCILGYYNAGECSYSSSLVVETGHDYAFGNSRFLKKSNEDRPILMQYESSVSNIPQHQVVFYNQPKRNQMFSDMFEWKKANPGKSRYHNNTSSGSNNIPINNSNSNIQSEKIDLGNPNSGSTKLNIPKNAAASTPSSSASSTPGDSSLTYIASIHQINTSRSVEWMISSKDSPLEKEQTKESALKAFSYHHSHHQPVLWFISRIQVILLSSIVWVLRWMYWSINWKAPLFGRIADFFLIGGFLEKRLVILLNFRDQASRLSSISYRWQNDPGVQRAWIRFYNISLSLLLDSFLGLIAAYLMWSYLYPTSFLSKWVTSQMTSLWGYAWLKEHIQWIMTGSPGGLKLNIATTNALGSVFLYYIESWSVVVQHLARFTPLALLVVTICGGFGLSVMIIVAYDIVYFINMHVYWLYAAITRLYGIQLVLLRSLWLLFRGKKSNILKQRIDSCNASLDQLVLGTLLFTSLIFLLPTTAIYYMFFVYSMALVLLLQAAAQLFVNLLNYSPLYSLLLFLFKSELLSAGIHFQIMDPATRLATSTSTTSLTLLGQVAYSRPKYAVSYFKLCKNIINFGYLFNDLKKAMGVIIANYELKKIAKCIALGETWQNKRFQPNRIIMGKGNNNVPIQIQPSSSMESEIRLK